MINEFEDITYELTDNELKLVPELVELLRRSSKENTYTSNRIMGHFNMRSTEGARVRKLIHHIRVNDLLEGGAVLSSSDGYYLSTDREKIGKYVGSLKQRISSIGVIVSALERQRARLQHNYSLFDTEETHESD